MASNKVEIPYSAVISHLNKPVKPIYTLSTQIKALITAKDLLTCLSFRRSNYWNDFRVNKLSKNYFRVQRAGT